MKKFQFEIKVTDEVMATMEAKLQFVSSEMTATTKPQKDQAILLITDKNTVINAFHINVGGVNYFIPEPDPILVYFHSAYSNYVSIKEEKKKVLSVLNKSNVNEDISIALYSYFGLTNGYVIFLFTAIEAFINRFIPDTYEYRLVQRNRTEIYNRDQIQRYLSFEEKLNKVLTEISGKNFEKTYPLRYQHIKNLKEFRDAIVHTKPDLKSPTPFNDLYKKALLFKYEDTLLATRDLLNFYQPNCVEDCPCGENW